MATGFLAGSAGDFVERDLARSGVEPAFARLATGETRSCPTIVNPDTREVTEILEPGPAVTGDEVLAFEEHFVSLLRSLLEDGTATGRGPRPSVVAALAGSLPPGCPPDFYASLIRAAAELRVPCVLDASGEPLRFGCEAGPWAVKINQAELVGLMAARKSGQTPGTGADAATAGAGAASDLADLIAGGVTLAVVTRGREGLLAFDGKALWRGLLPGRLEVIQPVGSGDAATSALSLGLAHLLETGALSTADWPSLGLPALAEPARADLIRDMVAAGAANAVTEGIGNAPPEVFSAMRARARVEQR